jgi:hypothetical protein
VIPAALLNFLSGLAAGAGINMLTSIEGGSNAQLHQIIIDSAIWIIAAMCLAYAAHLAELVEREADRVIDRALREDERRAVRKDEAYKVRWRYRITMTSSAVTAVSAAVLIPGLIKY